MSIRQIVSAALVIGAALGSTACTRTSQAAEAAPSEQKPQGQFCGGIAAIPCPEGFTCADDPRDDCDPNAGGADCSGICVKDKNGCRYDDPSRTYISRDPAQCATIRFMCKPGRQPFFDDCGCGCEPATP
jgi:hypothetical protein